MTYAAADAISTTRIYNDEHDGKRDSDMTTATNAFTREMTGNNLKVANGDATMNRADGFAASWPTAPTAEDTVMPQELKAILDDNNYSTKEAVALHDEDVEMPATGRNNGLQLIDLRGLSFDDPLWQTYVEQWTPGEMALLLGKAGFQTESFTEYGKPTTWTTTARKPSVIRPWARKREDRYLLHDSVPLRGAAGLYLEPGPAGGDRRERGRRRFRQRHDRLVRPRPEHPPHRVRRP